MMCFKWESKVVLKMIFVIIGLLFGGSGVYFIFYLKGVLKY